MGNVIGGLPGVVGATDGIDRGMGLGDGRATGGAVVRGKVGGVVDQPLRLERDLLGDRQLEWRGDLEEMRIDR